MNYKKIKISKRMEDATGQKFGKLTALYPVENKNKIGTKWKFKCECGCVTYNLIGNVKSGRVQSCGCLHLERISQANQQKHGMYKTSVYSTWAAMKSRCNDENNVSYKNYGGRGIKVCNRWNKFENFYKDMGKKPKGKTIDRIDNNSNYKPSNCRWATPKQQNNNNRNCHFIIVEKEKRNIKQWAKYLNISRNKIYYRIRKGIADSEVIEHFLYKL